MEPNVDQLLALLLQLAAGVSLAACAGLRAFMPLFVVGVAGRLEQLPLSGPFEWLASWPALIVFGVALVTELLADKIPIVDHFLDTVGVAVKPVAGMVLVAALITDLSPLQATVLAILLGGSAAGSVFLVKAKLRMLSTATTAGLGNPMLSTGEDAGALVGSAAAVLFPVLAVTVVLVLAVMSLLGLRRVAGGKALRGQT